MNKPFRVVLQYQCSFRKYMFEGTFDQCRCWIADIWDRFPGEYDNPDHYDLGIIHVKTGRFVSFVL